MSLPGNDVLVEDVRAPPSKTSFNFAMKRERMLILPWEISWPEFALAPSPTRRRKAPLPANGLDVLMYVDSRDVVMLIATVGKLVETRRARNTSDDRINTRRQRLPGVILCEFVVEHVRWCSCGCPFNLIAIYPAALVSPPSLPPNFGFVPVLVEMVGAMHRVVQQTIRSARQECGHTKGAKGGAAYSWHLRKFACRQTPQVCVKPSLSKGPGTGRALTVT